jgi:Na+/melibiose symporter-like transporter
MKITMGISTATLGFVLSSAGYAGDAMPASAQSAISFLFMGLPGIAMAFATVCYFFFGMSNKEWTKIRGELDARALEKAQAEANQ